LEKKITKGSQKTATKQAEWLPKIKVNLLFLMELMKRGIVAYDDDE
jgi:hypothetical protein